MGPSFKTNVLAVYNRASEADLVSGKLWYRLARETALNLAVQYKLKDSQGNPDYQRVCGIIAALSPNTGWKSNLALTAACLKRPRTFSSHWPLNVTKVKRILKGEDPLKVLGGHKVRAFYQNLVSGGDAGEPCIDRHALSVCLGHEASEADRVKLGNRVSLQRACFNAYRVASILAGVKVSEMQAITWITWRREKGILD